MPDLSDSLRRYADAGGPITMASVVRDRSVRRPQFARAPLATVAAVAIVLAAIAVVTTRNSGDATNVATAPAQQPDQAARPGLVSEFPEDHWHEAFGINICGAYQPNLPESVNSGIHTHGDGLIHVEATNSADTGKHATLGKFVHDYGSGFRITDSEIRLPDGKTYNNGDRCGRAPGQVAAYIWDGPTDKTPRIVTTDVADEPIRNNHIVTFSFNPADTALELPASVHNLSVTPTSVGSTTTP